MDDSRRFHVQLLLIWFIAPVILSHMPELTLDCATDDCSCPVQLEPNTSPMLADADALVALSNAPVALPNALRNWPEILERIGNRPVAICLDYDGTLSKHVSDPDKAFMDSDMECALSKLAEQYPVSIITGRPIGKIQEFLKGIGKFYFAANHGLYITLDDDSKEHFVVAEQSIPYLKAAYNTLKKTLQGIEGCKVEDNYLSVSVHYRNVDDEENELIIKQTVSDVCDAHKEYIRMTDGAKVWEVRPNMEWNKGKALKYILDKKFQNPDTIAFYIGDDTTDEDAFKVVRDLNGISILVNRPKATAAEYVVPSTKDVFEILTRLSDFAVSRSG